MKKNKGVGVAALVAALWGSVTWGEVYVTNVVCAQRYPWNGMVDIDYEVVCDDLEADVWVYCTGYDGDMETSMAPRVLSGEGANEPVKAGKHRMTWNVTEDYPEFASTSFTVKLCACLLTGGAPYMVVDLSGGVEALEYPVEYLDRVPEGGWSDVYKTDKLVLRLVPPGTFTMGSPTDELGRSGNEAQHPVTLTKPFYIGVFEVTQKQWFHVMGTRRPTGDGNGLKYGDTYPAHGLTYNDIRGSVNGTAWPAHAQVDADSFMGRLRTKVNMLFDLPTEAQWEYACRAGTSSALNSGNELTATGYNLCDTLDPIAWYYRTFARDGTPDAVGGSGNWRLPNAWGIYDMHGNVLEWCLDWYQANLGNSPVTNPPGPESGSNRVLRGGGYQNEYGEGWGAPQDCRSAARKSQSPGVSYYHHWSSTYEYFGFRLACVPAD